ncbi:SIMPL domain-containing protein [Pseudodonghicola flavimaris]|uniref:SIMPL domain-containing protein n=1 Tax=Pseudodonghicola flavimaris TaxID=3050036 RepID=A0ABT7F6T4_9RHOB|nr:SIMPL domain-containing protein [Pseudodonghicola flavimaris]MDK3020317.1 SIMPL domain-containing protein [Pseudodonghicola flavimaris]
MRVKWFAAAVMVGLMGTAAWAGEMPRQIVVTGEAQVEAVPDMAVITLGVTQTAREAAAALEATSTGVAAVLDRLEAAGIAARDMQTQGVSLTPQWSEARDGEARDIAGFVASNTVMVRVRDLDQLGAVMAAVVADGANRFDGLSFGLQDPAPLEEDARRQAVADGIARAKLLAEAAGVTLGPVQTIRDGAAGTGPQPEMRMRVASMSAVPVAAGEIEVSASVTMTFAIGD